MCGALRWTDSILQEPTFKTSHAKVQSMTTLRQEPQASCLILFRGVTVFRKIPQTFLELHASPVEPLHSS